MNIILLEDLPGLGDKGATVQVKPGYARNFLLPRRLAIATGTGSAKLFQELSRQREIAVDRRIAEARAEAARLEGAEVNISAQANDEDTLFGSITNADVADALNRAGHAVERRQIELEDHIKQLGKYDVPVKFFGGVTATVKVWVVRA
ncbi:MAG: 50S ribosomal protein L9 [Candidatus Eisenbacteria bacterium]|uniref:Large ribosomal subunit protein bL9 n=1 Tax=Eiseniibacteriota bacterium TaxID=2212470 RepID=A0A849SN40_UNCEI|nr:50S ribosomal protein L9 [Candidatus Eisenbacteria bacterium]